MARAAVFTFQPYDPASICALQTTSSLKINGTYANQTIAGFEYATLSGFQRCVTLSSGSDLSGVNVTIQGTSWSGIAVSQTISGPNAGTVSTTAQFVRVNSIAGDATLTGIQVGFGNVGQSRPFIFNPFNTPAEAALQVSVAGTINYNVRSTLDNVQTASSPAWTNDTTLSGAASARSTYAVVPAACQIVTNSAVGGSLSFTVIPTGV